MSDFVWSVYDLAELSGFHVQSTRKWVDGAPWVRPNERPGNPKVYRLADILPRMRAVRKHAANAFELRLLCERDLAESEPEMYLGDDAIERATLLRNALTPSERDRFADCRGAYISAIAYNLPEPEVVANLPMLTDTLPLRREILAFILTGEKSFLPDDWDAFAPAHAIIHLPLNFESVAA
jgi:hypothetical protein